jgi:DNA primase
MISEDIINQVLDRVDIVDVIGGYMPLKRAGRNFRSTCPFHHEKTPSFMVSPDKQIYHCFGCGSGGNVFSFLMKYERLEFPEAVELMAQKAGVEIPKWSAQPQERSDISRIHSANEAALNFYHYTLLKTEGAKPAYDYLKKRGISEDTAKRLKLGYAPNGWDSLFNHAKKKGLDAKILEKAGLVLAGRDGGFYDRFRHRIIFPILNQKGRVVGFGARVLDETLPKYINSPDTPVYNKGNNLYGLNLAVEYIKEKDFAIIVEGYVDFMTPFQAGVGNIVASLGTALTIEQIRLLKRYTRNVTMVFDPDSAGESASLRGLDLAVSEGLNVKIATLTKGYDPDKFVRQMGADKFLDVINNAKDFFEYKVGLLKAKFPQTDVESKANIAGQMLLTIAKVPNAIAKAEYMKRLSEILNVDPQALWAEIKKVKIDDYSARPIDFPDEPLKNQDSSLRLAEKMLLGLALEEPTMIEEIKTCLIHSGLEEVNEFKVLFDLAAEFFKANKTASVAKLINCLKNETHSQILSESCALVQDVSDKKKCINDCVKNIKQTYVKDKMQRLQGQIKTAQAAQDESYLNRLINEYNSLIRQKVEV